MRKKAQVWYTDFMIGLLIFIIVVFIYFEYAHSLDQNPTDITSDLIMDAKSITSSLVAQGSPADWNAGNVEIIGLTDGKQRIVESKLQEFADMPYQDTKTKLRTPYDYYLYFEDVDGNIIQIDGGDGLGMNITDADNVVSITRVVIYDSELINMVVQVWD